MEALVGGDVAAGSRAARALSHILAANPACKERLLGVALGQGSGAGSGLGEEGPTRKGPPAGLLPSCLKYLTVILLSPVLGMTFL